MNPIAKFLWKWQAQRKMKSDNPFLVYAAAKIMGKTGSQKEINVLLDHLSSPDQNIRNASAEALRLIIENNTKTDVSANVQDKILTQLKSSTSLIEKLALIEVMAAFTQLTREKVLGPLVESSEHDLQYAIIRSLVNTENQEILDSVLDASDTKDLILRKTALQTWYNSVDRLEVDESVEYCTPRLHYLIRAAYELQTDGATLRRVLSYANQNDLPTGKAYPDFMIRYLTELLGKWEYDPDAYRSLHQLVVPSYFTFEDNPGDQEKPFIIL